MNAAAPANWFVRARDLRDIPSVWAACVSAIWTGVGLAVLLALTNHVHFTWTPTPGIHSWVTENRYPIQQQVFWFYAVTLGVPVSVTIGHCVWAAMSTLLTSRGVPLPIAARASVLCLAPLTAAWRPLSRLDPEGCLAVLIIAALGVALLLGLVAAAPRVLMRAFRMELSGSGVHPLPPTASLPQQLETRGIARALRLVLVLVALPSLLYFARFDPRLDGGVDLFHEGEFLVPLQEVLAGGMPYRDVYLQHGFLQNVGIPWLGANLFAPTLAGVRWIQALVEPFGALGAYALIVCLTRARLLPALLLFVLAVASPVAVPSRCFFGLCSLAALASSLGDEPAHGVSAAGAERRVTVHDGWAVLCSGMLAAVALLHSTEVGLYSLATGALLLAVLGGPDRPVPVLQRAMPLVRFSFGALLVWAPFALWLAARGALDDFLLNLVFQTRYQLEVWGKPFPHFFDTFLPLLSGPEPLSVWWAQPRIWWYYCPALLTLCGAWLAHRAMLGRLRNSSAAVCLLVLSVAAGFYFRSALGRPDPLHVHYGILFSLLLLVLVADTLWRAGRRQIAGPCAPRSGRAYAAGLLLLATGAGLLPVLWVDRASPAGHGLADAWNALTASQQDRPGIRGFEPSLTTQDLLPPGQWQSLDDLAKVLDLETAPGERVLDFTNEAGQLFFAGRLSATRYFQIVYAALPEMQREVIDALEKDQTRLVLYKSKGLLANPDGIASSKRHPLLVRYLNDHYAPFRSIGQLQIWKRKQPDS